MGAPCRRVLLAAMVMFAYVTFYLAAVDRDLSRININSTADLATRYRFGGTYAHTFFLPVHHVDRRVRHDYCEPEAAEVLELLIANLDRVRSPNP